MHPQTLSLSRHPSDMILVECGTNGVIAEGGTHDNGNAVKVAPNLGDLTLVEGSFPTKHGVLHVRHEKNKDGFVSSEMHIPDGLAVH